MTVKSTGKANLIFHQNEKTEERIVKMIISATSEEYIDYVNYRFRQCRKPYVVRWREIEKKRIVPRRDDDDDQDQTEI